MGVDIELAGSATVLDDAKRLSVGKNFIYLGLDFTRDCDLQEKLFSGYGLSKTIVGVPIGKNYFGSFLQHNDRLYCTERSRIVYFDGVSENSRSVGDIIDGVERLGLQVPSHEIDRETIVSLGTDGYYFYLNVESKVLFTLDRNLNPFAVQQIRNEHDKVFSSSDGYFAWSDGLSWQKFSHGIKAEKVGVNLIESFKQYQNGQLAAIGYPYHKLDFEDGNLPFQGKADQFNPNIIPFTDGHGMYCLTGDGAIWYANSDGKLADIVAVSEYSDDNVRVPALTANNNGIAALLHGEDLRLFSKGEQLVHTQLDNIDSWNCTDMGMANNALYFLIERELRKFDLK